MEVAASQVDGRIRVKPDGFQWGRGSSKAAHDAYQATQPVPVLYASPIVLLIVREISHREYDLPESCLPRVDVSGYAPGEVIELSAAQWGAMIYGRT